MSATTTTSKGGRTSLGKGNGRITPRDGCPTFIEKSKKTMTAAKTATGDGIESLKEVNWPLLSAQMKYVAFVVIVKGGLMLMFLAVVYEGVRQVLPVFAQKLHRLPGLSFLYDYEATCELDLAIGFSILLTLAVWCLWEKILVWRQESAGESDQKTKGDKLLVYTLGSVILTADMLFFLKGMSELSWSGSVSWTAVLATAAYVGVLVFVINTSLSLRYKRDELKKGS